MVQELVTGRNMKFKIRQKVNKKQEGHDGPVSLHLLIHEIPLYQTLQYLGIGLKPLRRTKIGSHSANVK